jgi:hypothetical protein
MDELAGGNVKGWWNRVVRRVEYDVPGLGEAEALGREKLLPKYWLSRPVFFSVLEPFLVCDVLSFCCFLLHTSA